MSDDNILPLAQQQCEHRSGPPLSDDECTRCLAQLRGWEIEGGALKRVFKFTDFHDTMAFVNAVAWVAHRQDHHPHMSVGYNRCTLHWSTHSVNGLSLNDFICAARVDALLNGAS